MSESLWSWTLGEVRQRTASADPTPGGGSVAAISATLGCSLLIMAVEVTTSSTSGARTPLDLDAVRRQLNDLATSMASAADADIEVFEAVMAAYRMPRSEPAQADARRAAIASASASAAEVPLLLAEDCASALALIPSLEPAVLASITSDVLAGRDLLVGAARAALHTVSINLPQVEHVHREPLQTRAERVHRAMGPSL